MERIGKILQQNLTSWREQLTGELDKARDALLRSAINAHRTAMEQFELPFSQKVTDLQAQGKTFKWECQSQNVKTI